MTIDYQPLANVDPAANVETQAQFLTDLAPGGVLQNGFQAGTAFSAKVNKVLRQSSVMTAAIANAVSQLNGNVDILDDGNVAALTALLKLAMTGSAWTTGDVKLTMKTAADAGWLMIDDGTVGSGASGATHAADANQALFIFLWNTVSDTWAPVVAGRGGSALADWLANKRITLTRMLGRALAIAGTGSGLTARALGQFLGEELHVLSSPEVPATALTLSDPTHAHSGGRDGGAPGAGPGWGATFTGTLSNFTSTAAAGTGISGSVAGSGGGHNTMQPTGFLNAMIKQ